jgi:hypothetical protein
MNIALCRPFARDAGSETRVLRITSPPLKRWALIYRPCRDELFAEKPGGPTYQSPVLQHWGCCELPSSPGAALAVKGRNMNIAICRVFGRRGDLRDSFFEDRVPSVETLGTLIYRPCRDGCSTQTPSAYQS